MRLQDPSDSSATYTLLSFDPDAPSKENQEYGPWRHYVLGGLKPKSLEEISAAVEQSGEQNLAEKGLVEQTEQPISPWVAPSPGKGTGLHRYCFALYKQPAPLKPIEQQSTIKSNERPDRRKFDVAKFASDNNLELVGFNFFLVSRMNLLTIVTYFTSLITPLNVYHLSARTLRQNLAMIS